MKFMKRFILQENLVETMFEVLFWIQFSKFSSKNKNIEYVLHTRTFSTLIVYLIYQLNFVSKFLAIYFFISSIMYLFPFNIFFKMNMKYFCWIFFNVFSTQFSNILSKNTQVAKHTNFLLNFLEMTFHLYGGLKMLVFKV